MTFLILAVLVGLVLLVTHLINHVHGSFMTLGQRLSRIEEELLGTTPFSPYSNSERLTRIEDVLGGEEWRTLPEGLHGREARELGRDTVLRRLDRIEAAVDPLARARQQVAQRMQELDRELKENSRAAYSHYQAGLIEELVEKGERPDRDDWDIWIGTPYPWD